MNSIGAIIHFTSSPPTTPSSHDARWPSLNSRTVPRSCGSPICMGSIRSCDSSDSSMKASEHQRETPTPCLRGGFRPCRRRWGFPASGGSASPTPVTATSLQRLSEIPKLTASHHTHHNVTCPRLFDINQQRFTLSSNDGVHQPHLRRTRNKFSCKFLNPPSHPTFPHNLIRVVYNEAPANSLHPAPPHLSTRLHRNDSLLRDLRRRDLIRPHPLRSLEQHHHQLHPATSRGGGGSEDV